MPDFEFPSDAEAFFRAGRQLDVDQDKLDNGPIVLKTADELRLRDYYVSTHATQFSSEDPHHEEGYYIVPAVSLVAEAGYDADGVLLWIPAEEQYASYDIEHCVFYRYADTTWSDIEKNPAPYLNVSAGDSGSFDFVDMKPWEKYPWIATEEAWAAMEAQRQA